MKQEEFKYLKNIEAIEKDLDELDRTYRYKLMDSQDEMARTMTAQAEEIVQRHMPEGITAKIHYTGFESGIVKMSAKFTVTNEAGAQFYAEYMEYTNKPKDCYGNILWDK